MQIQRPAPNALAAVSPLARNGCTGLIPSVKSFGMPISTMMANGTRMMNMNASDESPTIAAPRMFT